MGWILHLAHFFWNDMIVYALCQKLCPELIPPNVSPNRIGDGADGEVFELLDDPTQVIKFCVLYDTGSAPYRSTYKAISKTLTYLMEHPSPAYARVYTHVYMGEWTRPVVWGNTKKDQPFIVYYYTMDKLFKISDDEQRVFHSILSHEDRGIKKNFSPDKLKEMLEGLQQGLDFDVEKVTLFHNILKKTPLAHLDIHVRNIMKDASGNFKMIDFDRVQTGDGNGKIRKTRG